jgi:superfamily I DNA and RNA helicase
MGLLRDGGPLQGVSKKDDWEDLGYTIVEGDFSPASVSAGRDVVLERPAEESGHPIDQADFDPTIDRSDILTVRITENETDDVDFVVSGIRRDLESGLRPEDIAVVCLEPLSLLGEIGDQLQVLGIGVIHLNNQNNDMFRQNGYVTLSGIRRAKGNEAYKVYALNLHMVNDGIAVENIEDEMVMRNQVFVALTRTKLWCVAVGHDSAIMRELAAAAEQNGTLRFPAFNQQSLRRLMVDSEAPQKRLI